MAGIQLDISFGAAKEPPSMHAGLYRQLTEALVRWNAAMLPDWQLPPLYKSGVRYKVEKQQFLPDAFAIAKRKHADCGPLAAWRCGELRLMGEPARVRIYWRPISNGQRLFHAQVRRGSRCLRCGAVQATPSPPRPQPRFANCVHCGAVAVPWGAIEDPSRLLGMPTHA
jgi:hypothetical protein